MSRVRCLVGLVLVFVVPSAAALPASVAAPVSAVAAVAAPASAVAVVAVPPVVARFRWPLDGTPVVVRGFDPPPQPWLAGHRGVDLAAVPGSAVRAGGAGVVHFAGLVAGRGVVSVDHPGGLRTTYEPVQPAVRVGTAVSAGDLLGRLAAGHPGCRAAACLHWGLRRGDAYLDPLSLLGLARVRLLPLDGRQLPARRVRSRAGRRSASRSYSSGRL